MDKKKHLNWDKLKDALVDSAKISTKEIKRGILEAKSKFSKYQLIQSRKELFAELGRSLYEAEQDGLPEEISKFVQSTELHEIIEEIKQVDTHISTINKRCYGKQ